MMNFSPEAKKALGFAAGTAVFWVLLACLRFPGPGIDDLFFVGTAVNLAEGGAYVNPWTAQWNTMMSSGLFFFQPPFYSYVLAGWLKVFGLSTNTLVAFQCLWGFVFSLSAAALLRHYRAPFRILPLIPLVYAFNMRTLGFRPDAMTYALLVLGLLLLAKDRPWTVALGFFFLGSSVLTLTVVVAFAVPLTAAVLWLNYLESADKSSRYMAPRLGGLVLAAAVATLLFLVCIDFKMGLFIKDYLDHAALRRDPAIKTPGLFIQYSLQYWGYILIVPTYLLMAALLGLSVWRGPKPLPRGGVIWVGAVLLALGFNVVLYVSSSVRYAWLLFWLLIPFIWVWLSAGWSRGARWAGGSAIGLVLFLSQTTNWPGYLFNQPGAKKENYEEIRAFVAAHPEREYAIDCVAAYEVFDYRLPAKMTDWHGLTKPRDPVLHLLSEKKPDMTWIAQTSIVCLKLEDLGQDYPRVEVLGRRFNSLPLYPNQVSFFP